MAELQYWLSKGAHESRTDGLCANEWMAYLAGEDHSDDPQCVSPVLRAFALSLNDAWDDEQRQKLRPFLARCLGTAGDGRDMERGWLAMDWLVRVYTPAFLELVPSLRGDADLLRALPAVCGEDELCAASEVLLAVRDNTAATRGVTMAATWAVARAAAWTAAWAVTWAVTRAVTRTVAWTAARDVTRAAARTVAWTAARDVAWDVLQPTVFVLQASALDLFDRMLPTELVQIPAVGSDEAARVCGLMVSS